MTTKAQTKAAEVAQRKFDAFTTKVRTLTGHAYARRDMKAMSAAFDAGTTADAYAAEIASQEPVGQAVHPMKVEAVQAANQRATRVIERIRADLEAHGWDCNAAAPYPFGMSAWSHDYQSAKSKANLYGMLVKDEPTARNTHRMNAPRIVVMCDEYVEHFIKQAEEMAAAEYDAFICKLVAKVGEVTTAALEGNHVWGDSYLTVTTADGANQIWHTKQIWNVSKLGKDFPQWPTRLMK